MPEISATERGKRYFQVMKEKQAEKAMGTMQKHLGTEWQLFSLTEVRALKHLLGEAWVYLDQKAWDTYPFHELSRRDLLEMIKIGGALQRNEIQGRTAATAVESILKRSPVQ